MNGSPLVSSQWLEDHLNRPDIRIIEVSSLNDESTYRRSHIPGATWVFWKDFLWQDLDREFVSPSQMAERLGRLGVGSDTTVVLYGDPVQYGTYAFWVLRMAGHKNLRILDGTRTKWIAEGRPLSVEVPQFSPVAYSALSASDETRLGRDEVRARLGRSECTIIDARSPEEYSGARVAPEPNPDHGAERKGRIPGAKHLYYRELLNDDDTFKSADEIRTSFVRSGIKLEEPEEFVCYCRLSHRATLVWVAMKYLLGKDNTKIYDGSWTEWGSIVGFPIEK